MGNVLQNAAMEAKDNVIEFQNRGREVQIAMNIAWSRDLLQYLSGVWLGLASLGTIATIKHKAFPVALAPPLVILPIIGGYQYDMAYGTKARRMILETEHILDREKFRFIPPKQAPFYKFYDKEISQLESTPFAKTTRVGEHWPKMVRDILENQEKSSSE